MEVPTTSTPNGHHLPPIPNAGPRGPAPNGRTSPPLPRHLSESDRQRFTRIPTRQQTERPARPPPSSQGRRPALCRGDNTPRTHGQRNPRPTKGLHKGWGDNSPSAPPPRAGRDETSPGHGHRPPDQLGPYTTGFPTSAATDLRNPPNKNFTLLSGEVAKFRTVTENQEQQGRDGDEVERCLPQNT